MFNEKRMLKICCISFLLLFFANAQAFAETPVVIGVSGTFSHNLSVTIVGSNFGTKISGQAAPIRFDDFEEDNIDLGDGVEIALGQGLRAGSGFWSRENGKAYAQYDDGIYSDPYIYNLVTSANIKEFKKLGTPIRPLPTRDKFSKKHIRWHAKGWNSPGGPYPQGRFTTSNVDFPVTRKAYVNLWALVDYVSGIGDVNGQLEFKLANLLANGVFESHPHVRVYFWSADNEHTSWFQTQVQITGNNYYMHASDPPAEGEWFNLVFQYQESSNIGSPNGFSLVSFSRTPIGRTSYSKGLRENIITRTSLPCGTTTGLKNMGHNPFGDDGPINSLSLGFYITAGAIEGNSYWDDIYIDNSWARVEIGDKPNYDECTHREIQIPSNWSNGSIDITVKQGSFADNSDIYVFVVNEDGIASEGYGSISFGTKRGLPSKPKGQGFTVD